MLHLDDVIFPGKPLKRSKTLLLQGGEEVIISANMTAKATNKRRRKNQLVCFAQNDMGESAQEVEIAGLVVSENIENDELHQEMEGNLLFYGLRLWPS
jgi:hypothetical protein